MWLFSYTDEDEKKSIARRREQNKLQMKSARKNKLLKYNNMSQMTESCDDILMEMTNFVDQNNSIELMIENAIYFSQQYDAINYGNIDEKYMSEINNNDKIYNNIVEEEIKLFCNLYIDNDE